MYTLRGDGMTKYNVEWRTEALREGWDQQMSPQDFAEYVGVSLSQAYAILSGRDWPSIPRPDGYVYPFPAYGRRDGAWQTAQLAAYVDRRMTVEQFAAHMGVRPKTAEHILRGYTWKSIPRPEGFQYPWPLNEGEKA